MVSDDLRSTISSYDSIAVSYEARNADAPAALEAFRSAFAGQLRPASVVADLGCGPGRDVAFFAERGLIAVGVDASKAMVERVSQRGLMVVQGDIRRAPLRIGAWDGIWCCAALLHVRRVDVVPTLKSWHALLRPNGLLGLSTSLGGGEGWEEVPYDVRAQGYSVPLRRWFVHHHRGSLEAAIGRAGFRILDWSVRISHRQWLQVVAAA